MVEFTIISNLFALSLSLFENKRIGHFYLPYISLLHVCISLLCFCFCFYVYSCLFLKKLFCLVVKNGILYIVGIIYYILAWLRKIY